MPFTQGRCSAEKEKEKEKGKIKRASEKSGDEVLILWQGMEY